MDNIKEARTTRVPRKSSKVPKAKARTNMARMEASKGKGKKNKGGAHGNRQQHQAHSGPIKPINPGSSKDGKDGNGRQLGSSDIAQVRAIGKTLSKMQKKQHALLKKAAPSSSTDGATTSVHDKNVALQRATDAPLEDSIVKAKKWGKGVWGRKHQTPRKFLLLLLLLAPEGGGEGLGHPQS